MVAVTASTSAAAAAVTARTSTRTASTRTASARLLPTTAARASFGPTTGRAARSREVTIITAAAGANGNGKATEAKPDKRLKPFTNTNMFVVPEECQFQFELEWKKREEDMNLYTGFEGLKISRDGSNYTVSSSWATCYDWEDWSSGIHHRRSHLPIGVMQYPPKKGTGFAETFVPLIGLTDAPMLAQY